MGSSSAWKQLEAEKITIVKLNKEIEELKKSSRYQMVQHMTEVVESQEQEIQDL